MSYLCRHCTVIGANEQKQDLLLLYFISFWSRIFAPTFVINFCFPKYFFFLIIFRKANFPFFNSYTCNFLKNSFLDKKKELKPANQCKRQDRKNTRKKKANQRRNKGRNESRTALVTFEPRGHRRPPSATLSIKFRLHKALLTAARPPQRQKVRVWRCRWPTAKILCTLEAPAATITCTNEHLSAGKEQKNTIFEVVRQSCMDPNVVACACDSNSAGAF